MAHSTKDTTAQQSNDDHLNADTDNSLSSIHHTLGTYPSQSSPGNHVHDGKSSLKLYGAIPPVVTGSRAGNIALGSLLSQLAASQIITDNTTA